MILAAFAQFFQCMTSSKKKKKCTEDGDDLFTAQSKWVGSVNEYRSVFHLLSLWEALDGQTSGSEGGEQDEDDAAFNGKVISKFCFIGLE